MSLVILVPVLRRPHRIIPVFNSIRDNTSVDHRILFIASPSDSEEIGTLQTTKNVEFVVMDRDYEGRGDYARKINYGYQVTTEPYIFLGADDLSFYPNWFEYAVSRMVGRVGVVGTNDLGNPRVLAGRHSTHSLVLRGYIDKYGTIDERGKILHEGYPHEFVDDEFVATAQKRRCWAFSKTSIVEHLHPHWGKAPTDDVYGNPTERMMIGSQLFRKRSRLWR